LSLDECIDKTGAHLEEQFFTTSLIQGQLQLINTNSRSSIDNLIHAMGAMSLFTSNAMGAMDKTTQQHAKQTVCTPTIKSIPYMPFLQNLNHLGSAMLTPYGSLQLIEPLVHHHRLLNYC
jgi:hypothetical protein